MPRVVFYCGRWCEHPPGGRSQVPPFLITPKPRAGLTPPPAILAGRRDLSYLAFGNGAADYIKRDQMTSDRFFDLWWEDSKRNRECGSPYIVLVSETCRREEHAISMHRLIKCRRKALSHRIRLFLIFARLGSIRD